MLEMILDVLLDAIIDSAKLIPFLFITYLIMEYLEHKTSDKNKEKMKNAGKMRTNYRKYSSEHFLNVVFLFLQQICMLDV